MVPSTPLVMAFVPPSPSHIHHLSPYRHRCFNTQSSTWSPKPHTRNYTHICIHMTTSQPQSHPDPDPQPQLPTPQPSSLYYSPIQTTDLHHIKRCIHIASTAIGQTRPNPIVGCTIFSSTGTLLGEGFHARAGQPHAEINAITSVINQHGTQHAYQLLKDCTFYVSLEPCNHYGRTPPCSDALVKVQPKRVVVGMVDPDPRTSGAGISKLRSHGIHVDVMEGEGELLCKQANEGFIHRVRYKRPLGVWKYAVSMDGRIASDAGRSQWVSGKEARMRVMTIRASMDAVIVGGETVRRDDPNLTVRDPQGEQVERDVLPYRAVMSASLDLPREAKLWDCSKVQTIVVTSTSAPEDMKAHLRARGVEVYEFEQPTPLDTMNVLYDKGCLTVLWECGGKLASEAVKHNCVQKVVAFVAPKLIGGSKYSPLASIGVEDMSQAIELWNVEVEVLGNKDVMIAGYI